MLNEITKEGPSVEEALEAALRDLGVERDGVDYEVLEEGGRRIFGAVRPALVRVWPREAFADDVEDDKDEIDIPELLVEAESVPADLLNETSALTDEELDKVADEAVAVINDILRMLGLTASIEEYEGDDSEIILDIVGDDLGVLIGRHGRTLDSLQILVSAIAHRRLDLRHPTVVDVSGYRHRRRLKVEEIAKRAADRVARGGRPVPMRPMTSFERKVVHVALRNDRRVRTESEGVEPYRQVVVHPK
jgi:spoIIIJ-associated protein